MIDLITDAIRRRIVLSFVYDGHTRHVEPHCLGTGKTDNHLLRGFQIGGQSNSRLPAWKLFDMSKAEQVELTEVGFVQAREGFKQGDRAMTAIIAELDLPIPEAA